MHTDLVQDLRYKLQKRVRRINSAETSERFLEYISHLLSFLEGRTLFRGILDSLDRQHEELKEKVGDVLEGDAETGELRGLTESEQAAVSYFVLQHLRDKLSSSRSSPLLTAAMNLSTRHPDGEESRHILFDNYVEFLYDFVDEHIDDQRALLAMLVRYKHRSEWFERERLFGLWEEDLRRREWKLAEDLYAYLYDQGVEFTIEPYSVSGEADLIAAQPGGEPLIADAKIFNPGKSKGRSYIADGFNQTYTYTKDHNEPFGYLVIFNTVEDKLNFALSDVEQSTPYVTYNGKTIFFVEVDIYPYEKSASQRGKLKGHEVTEEYLVRQAELDES